MIIAIRISGQVGIKRPQKEGLDSLMLRKKYTGVLLSEKEVVKLNKVKELITFGEIEEDTLKDLLAKRGRKDKKAISDVDKIVDGLKKGKKLKELGVTPYLRLHPPRGGFKKSTKLPYPKGILGKNKDINKLVKRML